MFAVTRRRLEMVARVRDFIQANPATDASYVLVVGQLREGLARAEALARLERDGRGEEPLAVARRIAFRDELHQRFLPHLIHVVERARTERPTLGDFSRPRSKVPLNTYITAARAMEAAAIPERELLQRSGLGETFLDRFHQAIADFDLATEAVHAARRDHIGARSELRAVAAECLQLVGVLNGLIHSLFKERSDVLAAWESARTVVHFRRSPEAQPSAPSVVPTTTEGAHAA